MEAATTEPFLVHDLGCPALAWLEAETVPTASGTSSNLTSPWVSDLVNGTDAVCLWLACLDSPPPPPPLPPLEDENMAILARTLLILCSSWRIKGAFLPPFPAAAGGTPVLPVELADDFRLKISD